MELGKITDEDLSAWVPFGTDGEVLIAFLPREDLNKIEAAAVKVSWKKHRMIEELDEIKRNKQMGRSVVKDWKSLTVGGEEFPYSKENCDFLMAKSYQFSDFVNITCVEMAFFVEEKHCDAKKNSKPDLSGS